MSTLSKSELHLIDITGRDHLSRGAQLIEILLVFEYLEMEAKENQF